MAKRISPMGREGINKIQPGQEIITYAIEEEAADEFTREMFGEWIDTDERIMLNRTTGKWHRMTVVEQCKGLFPGEGAATPEELL